MELTADSKLDVRPGNFSARVDGQVLAVPPVLAELARAQHLYSAEEFAGFARAFPSSVAEALGWPPGAALAAAARLNDQLTRAGVLSATPPVSRVYGLG